MKEKQFSMQMISEDTQLVLIDEWLPDTLQSDAAKVTLQDNNTEPFYIATNDIPFFEEDDENVHHSH